MDVRWTIGGRRVDDGWTMGRRWVDVRWTLSQHSRTLEKICHAMVTRRSRDSNAMVTVTFPNNKKDCKALIRGEGYYHGKRIANGSGTGSGKKSKILLRFWSWGL